MRVTPITVLLLISINLNAVTLDELIANAKEPQLIEKTIDAQELALESQNLAQTETAPLTYHQSFSQNQGTGESGLEYEVSFSKEFKLGDIRELEQRANRLKSRAYLLEKRQDIYRYNAYLGNLYHGYCLNQDYINSFQEGLKRFTQLYSKKEQAYREDEISKTELLQLGLEKQRLESELNNRLQQQQNAKEQLFGLTTLQAHPELSCQDIYPIQEEVVLSEDSFALSQEAFNKRIKSRQVGIERYSQKIEHIDVSMGYTKELNQDIYTIALSVPLDFSTHKSEYERASLLHQSSALTLQNEQMIERRRAKIVQFQKELEESFAEIASQKKMIQSYTSSLLPLMKKSYEYGESSVIEYLLSEQKLYQLKEKLLEKKRGYFKTLFKLYSMIETKEIL